MADKEKVSLIDNETELYGEGFPPFFEYDKLHNFVDGGVWLVDFEFESEEAKKAFEESDDEAPDMVETHEPEWVAIVKAEGSRLDDWGKENLYLYFRIYKWLHLHDMLLVAQQKDTIEELTKLLREAIDAGAKMADFIKKIIGKDPS